MSQMILGLLISTLKRLVTAAFFDRILVEVARAGSDRTANEYDDHIVDAVAKVLGVDSKSLKDLQAGK